MSTQFFTQGKMKIIVLLAVMLLGVGSFLIPSQPASASHQSEGTWANAVSGCAVDDGFARKYAVLSNRVQHKAGYVGAIIARCNIENLPLVTPGIGEAGILELTFRDPDGPGGAYVVIAQLKQLANHGKVTTLATVTSETSVVSWGFQTRSTEFTHHFDFRSNAYFVEVIILRNDAEQIPAASIVRLYNSL